MKSVITFLFAVSTLAAAQLASASTVQLDRTLIQPEQTEAIVEGHDAKLSSLGFELKGLRGAALWINEINVIYDAPGLVVRKKVYVNQVVVGNSGAKWFAIPQTGFPVHRVFLEVTTAGIQEDSELTAFGK